MGIPLIQKYRVGRYILTRKLRGETRYPLVLMLEPLFQCNLACAGCGKIDYPKEILQRRMSVADALAAVDQCGAPIVSIPGGEPLIHKELPQIVSGIVARKKFVYLCTNAILLKRHIDDYQPSPYLTFSIHLDGDRERHDESVCEEGVFDKAVAAIKLLRERGFRVTVNCTLFSHEDPERVAELLRFRDRARRRGNHYFARLSLCACPTARRVSRTRRKQAAYFAPSSRAASSAGDVGVSISRPCFSISWPAIKPINARRGAILPTTSSAGSVRAISDPMRVTPAVSAS